MVVFDQAAFLIAFPEFAATLAVPTQQNAATTCFTMATYVLDNTDNSIVRDEVFRAELLNLLVAHLLSIYYGVNGKKPARAVGRVSSAGEGSVNVSLDMGPPSAQAAWYNQTIYGAQYFVQTAGFRSMMYIPPPSQPQVIVLRG